MYKHPNTHISKQIHTEASKEGLESKKSKLYKIDILYNLGEQHFTNSWLFKRIFVKPARSSVLAQPNVLRFNLLKLTHSL